MSTVRSRILEDARIGVRLKISSLWVAMLFLFAYGDIFGSFQPGHIEEVTAGQISGIEITQVFLLAISVYISVFLTLVLKPSVNRWINTVLPILYVVSIAASVIGETWAYFLFLSATEGALLLLIIWYAWTWPTQEEAGTWPVASSRCSEPARLALFLCRSDVMFNSQRGDGPPVPAPDRHDQVVVVKLHLA